MEDCIMNHMTQTYAKTRWRFFSAVSLLKIGTRDELNRLWKEKKIEVRDGIQGKIVELKIE